MAERVPIREGTFIESAKGGILLANRCKSCGQTFFPKSSICFNCFSEDMEEMELSRIGKLYSFATAYMPSVHFQPPYTVGMVEMPEGMRVFGPLKIQEGERERLRVGMEMEVIIEKLWEEGETEVIGYKFKPVIS